MWYRVPTMCDPLLSSFLAESRRLLTQTAEDLRHMDRHIGMAGASEINACYRAMHTIAGLADHLGLARIRTLAGSAEALLEEMRINRLHRGEARIAALLRAVARLFELVECLEHDRAPATDDQAIIGELRAWMKPAPRMAPRRSRGRDDRSVPRFSHYGNQIPSGPPCRRATFKAGQS